MINVLIVEDEIAISRFLRAALEGDGLRVHDAGTLQRGLIEAATRKPDLVILDLGLPDMDGLDVCRRIREKSETPILMLTARGDAMDRVVGLEMGADDYLPKPFEPRELALRIAAILRRAAAPPPANALAPDVARFGACEFLCARGELRRAGEALRITDREREILRALVSAQGAPVARAALAGDAAHERTIDVQVTRLRRKIEADPANPLLLQTVRGAGYRLVLDQDARA